MRYIANSDGYLQEVSFGAEISCDGQSCTEYTGSVPDNYGTLENWYLKECEKLCQWKVVSGELVQDTSVTLPVDVDPVAQLRADMEANYLPLDGDDKVILGVFGIAERMWILRPPSGEWGTTLAHLATLCTNAKDGTVTPLLTAGVDGYRTYGIDVLNNTENPVLRIYAGENYVEVGSDGLRYNEKAPGQTLLWSGELASGSESFETEDTYDRYLVVGRVVSGYPLSSVTIPADLTGQKWGLSDEEKYLNFTMTTNSVDIATNSSGSGSIVAVYGIN